MIRTYEMYHYKLMFNQTSQTIKMQSNKVEHFNSANR